ncbi:MAG: energy transducer TonB [Sphingobacteriia bacterium]
MKHLHLTTLLRARPHSVFSHRVSILLLLLLGSISVAHAQQPADSARTGGSTRKTDLPDPNALVEVDQQPTPLNMHEAMRALRYPKQAEDAEIAGRVILKVLIDEEGKPIQHVVLKSPHPSLAA